MDGAPQTRQDNPPDPQAEIHDLRRRVVYLERALAQLDRRLKNVEASVIFKFLRWLGSKFLTSGQASRDISERYAAWTQEVALTRKIEDRAAPVSAASVAILLDARTPGEDKLARTVKSLAELSHTNWELIIPEGHASLDRTLARDLPLKRPRIISSLAADIQTEFVLFLPAGAVLEPCAVNELLAAAGSDAVAVHSDWDHLESNARPASPRFTPELSPELLAHTPYWGDCFLVRTAALRQSGAESLRDLSLRLAASAKPVRRVPQILWHQQEPPPKPTSARPPGVPFSEAASIIICTRNPAQIRKCLESLKPSLNPLHEVIVVIHSRFGDTSGIDDIARQHGARAVCYEGPFHFGEMNRLGVDTARHEFLCLLNDDVAAIEKDWLDRMVAQAAAPGTGVVGALLLYPNHTIQHAGIVVGDWIPPSHIGRGLTSSPLWPWLRMTREVTAVTGACMVMRRSVWKELDGFDPRFPVNYNDVDLCLRAGELGYRVLLEAHAVLIHEEARTRIAEVRPEERALFYERWASTIGGRDRFFNPQLSHESDSIELPSPWTSVRTR